MKLQIVNRYPTVAPLSQQRGVASLLVSIVILSALTTVTVYTAKSIMTEQKISNNTYRSQQAFEAAEAGLAVAINYLSEDPDRDRNDQIDPVFNIQTDANNFAVGTSDTDVIGTSNRVIVTVTDMDPPPVTTPVTPPTFSTMRIVSQGFSDDDSATRIITQIIAKVDPLPNTPDNPMTTRGTVTIVGSATVTNPEGHSTIWSGGDIDLGANNSTATNIADVSDASYPGCMDVSNSCPTIPSSNKTTIGLDVIEYDSSLAALSQDEFFENFFGMSLDLYRESMVSINATPGNVNNLADLATNEVIWVDGSGGVMTTFTGITVGCATTVSGGNTCPIIDGVSTVNDLRPSVLIIDGDATFTGQNHFYGIVFVTGNTTIGGNTTIEGSLIATGPLANNNGGSLDIIYNSSILGRTQGGGQTSASAGTWHDLTIVP